MQKNTEKHLAPIKAMRTTLNIDQGVFAEMTGTSKSTIQKLEQNMSRCSQAVINSALFALSKKGITFEEKDGKGVITFPLDLVKW